METKEIGRRGVLRMLLGLGAVAVGASVMMMPGEAQAATPPAREPEPENAAADMAPDSDLPASEQTQYVYVRRRRRPVYARRRVVYVRPRRRVVYTRPRHRVYVVRRRRYY